MFSLGVVPLQEDCYLIGESGVLKDACDDAIDLSSAITLLVGLLILFATRTVYCMALVFPSEYSTSRRFKHLQYMSLTVSWPRIKAFYRSFLSNNVKDCILFKALPTYHLHGVAPLRALSCQAPWGSNASAACSAVPLHMGLCNVSGGSSATDDVSTCTARSGSGAVVCNATTTGSSGNCSYTPDASAACSAAGCVFANT